ncbi:MAG: DUF5686 family protein [Bacteroidota bacterium]
MNMKYGIAILIFLAIIIPAILHAESFVLRGSVRDSKTDEPIVSVNIRILGTSRGTVTNAQGKYSLSLDRGNYTIVYSYLGYQPETVKVMLTENMSKDIQLVPSPLIMPEVVVSSEDPAVEIIRKAIAHKHEWLDRLKTYQFEAFTRQILRRDTAIASISEAYTTGFMLMGDTLREIVKQKRQTQNIPSNENFAAVRRIVNFNDDMINLFSISVDGNQSGYRFVGPTAPDALDNYEYTLLNTFTIGGVEVYKIRMTPKSKLKPLFNGVVTIADQTFAVMGVDLQPNEAFTIPFVSDIDLHYRQQFGLYDTLYWMPTNITVTGTFKVNLIGLSFPQFGMELTSSIYDYTINSPIPDSVLHKPTLVTDSLASRYDSSYWSSHEVLPLTSEEQGAYNTLDSGQTLEKQFEPKGPLASLNSGESGSWLDNVDIRYNRVEGFFFGGKFEQNPVKDKLKLTGAAGWGFSDNDAKYRLGLLWYPFSLKKFGVGGEVYRQMDNIPDQGYYGSLTISLMALIDKNDYRDYFFTRGWRTYLSFNPFKKVNGKLSFIDEHQQSRQSNSTYSFFNGNEPFRANPAIDDGYLRAFRLDLHLGDEPIVFDMISRNQIDLSIEHSSPSIGWSDFDYTRYSAVITLYAPTFARDLLFSPNLRMRLSAGTSSGTLPIQRMFVPDSRASGYAPFGVLKAGGLKEFAGDRFVMINLEHNFRSLPFLALDIPFFYRNSIELVTFGSAAQTWYSSQSSSNGWYTEAGIGLSRILELLRFDLSYRFNEPRRFFLTLSAAHLF